MHFVPMERVSASRTRDPRPPVYYDVQNREMMQRNNSRSIRRPRHRRCPRVSHPPPAEDGAFYVMHRKTP